MATFGKEAFQQGLRELGVDFVDRPGNQLSFEYTIRDGRFKDQLIEVGLEVPSDFPATPPTGPHIKPRLIPISSAQDNSRAAESGPFGAEWQYLSRPFGESQQGWPRTARDVRTYLRHVARIFESL